MQSILAVTVPFFALVLLGYVAARYGKLPDAAIPGLNAFVLYFALPCLLFRFGMNTPVLQLLSPSVLAIWLACALLIVAFTVLLTKRGPVGLKDAAFGAQVAAFPNSGFMGVPLLVTLLGPAAAGPMIATILVDIVITSSLCIALAQWQEASRPGHRAAIVNALRGAASNPMPWAIVLGAASSATGLQPLGPVEVIVRMLADAATPVALFTIGAVLWHASQHAHTRTPPSRYVPVALVKLVAHPLLVATIGKAAQALGVTISDFELTVLTLTAALPSASNVAVLAERYGADNGRVARIIMASTSLSFVTLSGLAWWLGAGR
jgi:malonate transporter and related proteins